jgi:hypothetical protein
MPRRSMAVWTALAASAWASAPTAHAAAADPPGCRDDGPWPCAEDGCPAAAVGCGMLTAACGARFDAIWRAPPDGLRGRRVHELCPVSCRACAMARLLGREVLSPRDDATGGHEASRAPRRAARAAPRWAGRVACRAARPRSTHRCLPRRRSSDCASSCPRARQRLARRHT